MRILLAHNRYQQRGGEDIVFEQEAKLLAEAGHEVGEFVISNDTIESVASKAATFLNILDNRRIVQQFAEQVTSFKPELVHFHNFFPRLSPAAVAYSVQSNIPTVHTLHNFRHVCAGGMFLRNDSVCQLCLKHPMRLPAVIHRCYRNSAIGSYAVTRVGHRFRQLLDKHPHHLTLIALTEFVRQQMISDGFPPSQIVTKPNSVPDAGIGGQTRERRVLFVGRLSSEKGVSFFIELAKSVDAIFEIIGDGPEKDQLSANAPRNVVFRGWLDHQAVLERIKSAAVVVVPSRWFEGFSLIVAEAFSTATPVVVSRMGSLAELVEDDISGFTRELDDFPSWKEAIERLLNTPQLARDLGRGARLAFERKFTRERNLQRLSEIYSAAIERATMASGQPLASTSAAG
ncbi:glycosyltransferase family 4 protein [Bradyrhizobium sp.]|uniref:glycosyltransferase family 4 protein n=1 Tax=Bradyrhizobium sp. TaxID=376 RepID=UPI0039E4D98B